MVVQVCDGCSYGGHPVSVSVSFPSRSPAPAAIPCDPPELPQEVQPVFLDCDQGGGVRR